jgi:hypothetical protein
VKNKLLLHICCAPDEAWVIKTLKNDFELHAFFCNPNIQPKSEYLKRLNEAKKVADLYNVPFDSDPYDPSSWEKAIEDHKDTKEGGTRCLKCFDLRLEQSAKFCKNIGWESFTSVMSISPHKNINMLNLAGKNAADNHGVAFEPYNFKKKNGFLNSIKLCNELNLYRQDYCGCRLSRDERDLRNSSEKKEI